MYGEFGRAGENAFMTATAKQINQAIKSGKVPANASASQLYQSVVSPWMNSWGKGNLAEDPHGAAISNMVTQLISDWQSGMLTSSTPVGISGQTLTGLPVYGGG